MTDEDLVLALTELAGPVYKLRVKMVGEQRREGGKGQDGGVHAGIVCDGCEGPVTGNRYKCLHCPDFDLCSGCEGRGTHSLHRMVRIPTPTPTATTFRRQESCTQSRCPNSTTNILLLEKEAARQENSEQKPKSPEKVEQEMPEKERHSCKNF